MPKALKRLQSLIQKGLDQTAARWPTVRAAYQWVECVADVLKNANNLEGTGVKRPFRALLGAMAGHQNRSTPTLASMLAHFRKVTRSYWPGLFHCYQLARVIQFSVE